MSLLRSFWLFSKFFDHHYEISRPESLSLRKTLETCLGMVTTIENYNRPYTAKVISRLFLSSFWILSAPRRSSNAHGATLQCGDYNDKINGTAKFSRRSFKIVLFLLLFKVKSGVFFVDMLY